MDVMDVTPGGLASVIFVKAAQQCQAIGLVVVALI